MIPISRPSIGEEELSKVAEVFKTGWLGMGAVTFEFEEKIKTFLGSKNVVATNTGTSAIHLALDAHALKKGDEVIVPSITYAASIQAILATDASPVFCESKENDLSIDVQDVKSRITDKTKAIMPVHYCGQSCDMDELLDIADSNNIIIVEDAAHAFGSKYKQKYIGSFGHATCFSFDPIKMISCGEGGAVATQDEKLAELMKKKRILGIDKDTWHRYHNKRSWSYDVTTRGYRYHMSNFCAAIGLAQFEKLDSFISRRKEICKKYDKHFKQLIHVKPLEINYNQTAPFIYILKVKDQNRQNFIDYLKKRGIDTGIHYLPNHIHSYFDQFVRGNLPIAEKLGKEIVTIPLFVDMIEKEIQIVIDTVKSFDGTVTL